MGQLLYGGSAMEVEFDDRTLAHVQIVIGMKLSRKEGFFFSWKDSAAVGSGRSSIWLDSTVPLHFRFDSSLPVRINRQWILILADSANSAPGLQHIGEPGTDSAALELPRSRV